MLLFIACFSQEGAAGTAESLQTEQCTYSTASRIDPTASGSEYGHTKSIEKSGRCSYSGKYILSKSMLLFCHKNVNLHVWTYKNMSNSIFSDFNISLLFPFICDSSKLKMKYDSIWKYFKFWVFFSSC